MVRRALLVIGVSLLGGCGLFEGVEDPVLVTDSATPDSESDSSAEVEIDTNPRAETGEGDTGASEDSGVDTTIVDSTPDTTTVETTPDAGSEMDVASDVAVDTAPVPCSEGVVSCSGAKLEKCVGGTKTLVDTCVTPELCAASGAGPCKMPACAVAERRCSGKNLETCNAGRTDFEVSAACGLTCSAGTCLTLKQIEGGEEHSCALMSNGTVRCWGAGGVLGIGTSDAKLTPTEIPGLKDVAQLAVGQDHACARLGDGKVRCWGTNLWGQIGDGVIGGGRLSPVEATGVVDAIEVAAGVALTCVRRIDGTVSCWGQQMTKTMPSSESALHASPKAIGITGVSQLAVGGYHACGLKTDGTVYCWWGANSLGEHGDGTTDPTMTFTKASIAGVKQIAAGVRFTCALMSADNTVRCWGGLFDAPNSYGSTPATVVGLTGVASISAKGFNVCAKLIAGGSKCWGQNYNGEVGDGTSVTRLLPVAPTVLSSALAGGALSHGGYHTFVFEPTSAYAVGFNDDGQLGIGKKGGDSFATAEKVLW